MSRRISIISLALVVAITGIVLDAPTAEAQLFRRLRTRIESAIAAPPPLQQQRQPGELQRFPQPISPQPRTQPQPLSRPQGQRVSPIGPPTTAPQPIAPQSGSISASKPNAGATAAGNKFGNSILAPNPIPQPSAGWTQKQNSTQFPNDAIAGTGSAATAAASRASFGIEVVPSRGAIPGLQVVGFNDGSYADEAGLELDDVIVAVDGNATPRISDIAQLLRQRNSGDTVRTEIVRGRTTKVVMIPLIGNTVSTAKPPTAMPNKSEGPIAIGIEIQPSTGDRGMMVTDVTENSPAAVAGLQVGDRIVSIDGRLLLASQTLNSEFAKLNTGDEISLQVVRDGKLISAAVQMVDPTTLANTETKQPPDTEGTVFGGLGSVLGGLLSGKTNSKAETSLKVERSSKAESPDPKDELAFGDNEPVQRVGFESEIESQQKLLEGDPPSLETLEPPPGVATPIELNAIPQQAPQPLSSEELREQIRRLEQQLKDLEAVLEADPK